MHSGHLNCTCVFKDLSWRAITLFLILLLGLAQTIYAESQPVEKLTARVGSGGGELNLMGLDLLTDIGSFEIFRVGGGQRATIIWGPNIPKTQLGSFSGELTFYGEGDAYSYELKQIDPRTLRVRLTFKTAWDWPVGAEFCIAKLSSALFAGARVENGDERQSLPREPRPVAERWLFKDWRSLTVRSSYADLRIVPVSGATISLADFRQVPWDARRSFYLYSSRKAILPGETVDFTFDLAVLPPTLTVDEQFGSHRLEQVAPFQRTDTAFFDVDLKRAPDLPFRGVLTELLTPAVKDVALFKGYLKAISKAGGNTIILYHPPEYVLSLQQNQVKGNWWTRQELTEITTYARSLGISVIPGMSSKFDAKVFPRLSGGHERGFYDTLDPQSYGELFPLYQTLVDIYRPKTLLIGHDEIPAIRYDKRTDLDDARILASDIAKISDWLRHRQINTMVFGDMFLDRRQWSYPLTANSNNPKYMSANTHEALELLSKDIVILDWQYKESADYPTIDYFRQKGFKVWGVTWNDPDAAVSMAKSLVRYKGEGILVSDWGFWRTLNSGALTLYGVKAGYDSRTKVKEKGEDAANALVRELRPSSTVIKQWIFQPIDLSKVANASTEARRFSPDGGFVGLGSGFDLRALPSGNLKFADIPFRVLPSASGKNNCLIATSDHRLSIALNNRKVTQIAFLQTMRRDSPQIQLKPAGSYAVVYADGSQVIIPLTEGFNITDIRSGAGVRKNPWGYPSTPDILIGSYLGWRGPSLSGMPLNLQVMLWENPSPAKKISEIRLVPDRETILVLLGISVAP